MLKASSAAADVFNKVLHCLHVYFHVCVCVCVVVSVCVSVCVAVAVCVVMRYLGPYLVHKNLNHPEVRY